jgi:hypothetical protein
MRPSWFGLWLLLLVFTIPIRAQQSSPTAPTAPPSANAQGATLLQQGLAAGTGGTQITDMTLTGASTVAGKAGPQSGSVTLLATAAGQEQLTFTGPDGTHIDTRDFSPGHHAGNFSMPGGISGKTPPQNLTGIHPAWFFPAFILAKSSSSTNIAASDLGQETRNSTPVRHLAVWLQIPSMGANLQAVVQDVTQEDLYLDPSSLLPVAMTFRSRGFDPKNPTTPLRAIPTNPVEVEQEVRYSNYQSVQGVPVPFHIQIYVLGGLVDDIQLSSVSFNTGVSIAVAN